MTRIALIGAGRMGQVHLRVIRDLPQVEVAAVVDPREEIRAALAADGLVTFPDLDALLRFGRFDGAVVAVPSIRHASVVATLLRAGVPTLCEKPCGVSAHEAADMVGLAEESGCPLQIGYWRRFVPALRVLRDRIADGELGTILRVVSTQWDEWPPPAEFRKASGGILVDMGVHEFDQIRWLTGQEIECTAAVASSLGVDPPVEEDPETVEVVFELDGGGIAVASLGRRHPPGDMCQVQVFGTEGVEDCRFLWPPDSDGAFRDGIAAQARAFVELVRGGSVTGAGPQDAVAALAAADQAKALLQFESAPA
jgi:myo-inositol 2-dehydrogenase/D-chiro-inositol 1-dehydrogenase